MSMLAFFAEEFGNDLPLKNFESRYLSRERLFANFEFGRGRSVFRQPYIHLQAGSGQTPIRGSAPCQRIVDVLF